MTCTKDVTKKKEWLLALGISLFSLILALLLGFLRLEENDDAFISNIYANVWGTGYSEYAVYVNVLLGLFLKPFYRLNSRINWYVLWNLLLCFWSFTAISRVWIRKWQGWQGILAAVGFQLFFCWEHYCMFQYTKNAYLMLTAGGLLILEWLETGKEGKQWIPGAFLLLSGCALRSSCLMVAAAFAGVCILGSLLRSRRWISCCICFAVLGTAFLGMSMFDSWYYERDPQWAFYQEYNQARTVCVDYGMPPYEEFREEYEAIGFSELEHQALEWWVYADPEVYSLEHLETIADLQSDVGLSRLNLRGETFVWMLEAMLAYKKEILIVGILWLLVLLSRKDWKKAEALLIPFIIAGLYWYLVCNGRVNHRAVYGIWLAAVTFLLFYVEPLEKWKRNISMGFCAAGVFFLCSIPCWVQEVQAKAQHQWSQSYRELWEYMENDKDHLYLVDTITVVEGGIVDYSPLRTPGAGARSNVYLLGGWQVPMPTTNQVLENYGIENPFRELAEKNSKVILVDTWFAEEKEAYLKRNYTEDVKLVCIGQVGGFDLYAAEEADE